MFHPIQTTESGDAFYRHLLEQVKHLLEGERDAIANMANVSSLLFMMMEDVNWVGFYLWKDGQLVLGPFQGKPACVRIAQGKGVCGTAFSQQCTLVVPDVYKFPGHIFCDGDSRSEIVIPLSTHQPIGVLDIDSPIVDRFTEVDRKGLEAIVQWLIAATDF
ncbi:GAF domain-containing protein [Sulfoacidibacillus thermotolerans]|uniref:GAF domain-containing protein n=1 Tax=Sulfoacidibacillus thermotolerans TaxID=1765684 RepID=A0A2U3DCC9_SULT2|nr:GAF domain-containing protein [Sulfoacidibacillus thermotolerans]PWI58941.1 hypothetical protein BM613_02385 [Sulfoacidibacillus thermotolerans]